MPFYEHVYVYNLSYKLKLSIMAFASRPNMLVGLSATGSQWHLSFVVPRCGVKYNVSNVNQHVALEILFP